MTAGDPGRAFSALAGGRAKESGFSFSAFKEKLKEKAATSGQQVKVSGAVDVRTLAKQAETEIKEIAKLEAQQQNEAYLGALSRGHEVERSNLMNMIKIGFKTLIETSIGYAELDEEHAALRQCCTLVEEAFQHGFQTGNSVRAKFAARKGTWGVIEAFEKTSEAASAICRDVRAIPAVKTNLGKVRAWIRIAFQQKLLPDLMRQLVHDEALLSQFYEPHALLLSEEAAVIAGLLVSTNTIDCVFSLNPQMLDNLPAVIDMSLYLRDGNYLRSSSAEPEPDTEAEESKDDGRFGEKNFLALQDQKSRQEEANRVLATQLETLTAAHEELMNQIGPLNAELETLKTSLSESEAQKDELTTQLGDLRTDFDAKLAEQVSDIQTERETFATSRQGLDEMLAMTSKQMEREQKLREELECEVNFMRSSKEELESSLAAAETEMARKEEIIGGLRTQLKEVKSMNMDMLTNMQDAQLKIKTAEEALQKSEARVQEQAGEQKVQLDRLRAATSKRQELEAMVMELSSTMQDLDAQRGGLETNIAIEREYRKNVQAELEAEKVKTKELEELQDSFKRMNEKNGLLQTKYDKLQALYDEQEQALVEMGSQHASERWKLSELEARLKREKAASADGGGKSKPSSRQGSGRTKQSSDSLKGRQLIDTGALLGDR